VLSFLYSPILTSYFITGKTKALTRYPSSKNLQTINVGEDMEEREPSYTAGGNVN